VPGVPRGPSDGGTDSWERAPLRNRPPAAPGREEAAGLGGFGRGFRAPVPHPAPPEDVAPGDGFIVIAVGGGRRRPGHRRGSRARSSGGDDPRSAFRATATSRRVASQAVSSARGRTRATAHDDAAVELSARFANVLSSDSGVPTERPILVSPHDPHRDTRARKSFLIVGARDQTTGTAGTGASFRRAPRGRLEGRAPTSSTPSGPSVPRSNAVPRRRTARCAPREQGFGAVEAHDTGGLRPAAARCSGSGVVCGDIEGRPGGPPASARRDRWTGARAGRAAQSPTWSAAAFVLAGPPEGGGTSTCAPGPRGHQELGSALKAACTGGAQPLVASGPRPVVSNPTSRFCRVFEPPRRTEEVVDSRRLRPPGPARPQVRGETGARGPGDRPP